MIGKVFKMSLKKKLVCLLIAVLLGGLVSSQVEAFRTRSREAGSSRLVQRFLFIDGDGFRRSRLRRRRLRDFRADDSFWSFWWGVV